MDSNKGNCKINSKINRRKNNRVLIQRINKQKLLSRVKEEISNNKQKKNQKKLKFNLNNMKKNKWKREK